MQLSPIRCIIINDDHKTFLAVLPKQYCVFDYSPFELKFSKEVSDISLGTCASCSGFQYLAFSGLPADSQFDTKQVIIFDNQDLSNVKQIFHQKFSDHILSLSITPTFLICSFYQHVEIWDYKTYSKIQEIPTAINVHAPCDVNSSLLLATTGRNSQDITLISIGSTQAKQIHGSDNNVSLLHFSKSGEYLAVASSAGHSIRVFHVTSGRCLVLCKRGNTASVIHSVAFSPNTNFLAIISQNATVHFFDLRGKLSLEDRRSDSFPTIRACQKVKVGNQSTIARLCWFTNVQLAVMTLNGYLIVLSLDEDTCEEVGRSQNAFIRTIEETKA